MRDSQQIFLCFWLQVITLIEPERIICYNTPFPEMEGNIVFVDYELSSWKYQNDDYQPSEYAKYITGALPLPPECDIIIKRGTVVPDEIKGMGSAFGGEWKPPKPEDERFLGEPGEIKVTVMKNGEKFLTKIGKDGRAVKERHYGDHKKPKQHSPIHDHNINWEFPNKGRPNFEKPHINYWGEVPKFKKLKGGKTMNSKTSIPDYGIRFESIDDFKWCVTCGGEINFIWKGKMYAIIGCDERGIAFGEGYYLKDDKYYNAASHTEYDIEDELFFDTADEVLDIIIEGDRLRDIVTQINVTCRTL